MKKLMIAALAAGMVAGAYAEDTEIKVGYVYDMVITLKGTACSGKEVKGDAVCSDNAVVYYRTQVTSKIKGVFWGCGCDVIGAPASNIDWTLKDENGNFFWMGSVGWSAPSFTWDILNVVGKRAQNVEGKFTLELPETGDLPAFSLTGAGYGTAKIVEVSQCDGEIDRTDLNYIKSMKGYVVGSTTPMMASGEDVEETGCYYCGGSESTTYACEAWGFCEACSDTAANTALFGTFTLKYNASASSRIQRGKTLQQADSKFNEKALDAWKWAMAE